MIKDTEQTGTELPGPPDFPVEWESDTDHPRSGVCLALAGPTEAAASVTFTSFTGYHRRFSLKEADRYLLATRVGEEARSHGHGFPLRLLAPDKRGFEWVKWVETIEVNETSKW